MQVESLENTMAYDRAAGLSDMQWFMLRQSNIAHYAAFSTERLTIASLLATARALIGFAPQLLTAYRKPVGDTPVSDDLLVRLLSLHPVREFDGFPDVALNGDAAPWAPDLPMFRLSAFVRDNGPDAMGRASFLVVRVSHALVEGADSALLSRSQSAAHPVSRSRHRTGPLLTVVASALGGLAALAHLIVGNAYVPRPGPFGLATRVYPRRQFFDLARQMGVSQRALFFALVMHTLFGAGTPAGKWRISSTYSTIDEGGGAHRDSYMRMRMLFARFANAPDLPAFARAVQARLARGEGSESGFNAEFSAAGLHFHRWLSGLIPFAYRPQLFAFMPYDIVLGLIPPHRLGGGLTQGLIEPVYAGASTPGANACVIVPGRDLVSFNFFVENALMPRLALLDTLLVGNVVNPGFRGTPVKPLTGGDVPI